MPEFSDDVIKNTNREDGTRACTVASKFIRCNPTWHDAFLAVSADKFPLRQPSHPELILDEIYHSMPAEKPMNLEKTPLKKCSRDSTLTCYEARISAGTAVVFIRHLLSQTLDFAGHWSGTSRVITCSRGHSQHIRIENLVVRLLDPLTGRIVSTGSWYGFLLVQPYGLIVTLLRRCKTQPCRNSTID